MFIFAFKDSVLKRDVMMNKIHLFNCNHHFIETESGAGPLCAMESGKTAMICYHNIGCPICLAEKAGKSRWFVNKEDFMGLSDTDCNGATEEYQRELRKWRKHD